MVQDISSEFFLTGSMDSLGVPINGRNGESLPLLSATTITVGSISGQDRSTQIVCTIGPACDSETKIEELIKAGMNIARLNFSHGEHDQHATIIGRIRAAAKRLNQPVIIMQDLQGPKVRIGTLARGEAVELKDGAELTITTRKVEGNAREVSTSYNGLPGDVRPGDRLLLDDGLIELLVRAVEGADVHTQVVHGGMLKEHKGINLPGVEVGLPILTEKDRADLAFGVKHGIDWLAVSFVNRASDIVEVTRTLASLGPQAALIPVIAKVETASGVTNLAAILDAADGVMVARGDLGVELSPEFVPPIQKRIIKEANSRGKFVITATQMLESMTGRTRPTRAEASDVANAVYDGTNAVMLSAETASGDYPIESISMMVRLVVVAEATFLDWGCPDLFNEIPLYAQPRLAVPYESEPGGQ